MNRIKIVALGFILLGMNHSGRLLAAQSTTAGSAISSGHMTGSMLPATPANQSTVSDKIIIKQSSGITANCIDAGAQGHFCGSNALKWCNSHPKEIQCENLLNKGAIEDSP